MGGIGAAGALLAFSPARSLAGAALPMRGVNIPLWFDQDDGSDLPPSETVIDFLAAKGLDACRLPLSPIRFARADRAELTRLAKAVVSMHDRGLHVTLDLHPLGAFRDALEASEQAETVLVQAWSKLSDLARDLDPRRTALELLNEPPMWQDRWLPLRDRLAEIVRASTTNHCIVWGANRYQRIDETLGCPLLADDNAAIAIHYYSPMSFTHQCQNWGAQTYPGNEAFPTQAWGVADIDRDFSRMAGWAAETGVPVLVNEFGTLGFCSDIGSRATWTRAVREAAERHGFGWAYWELDRGFGFLESRDDAALVNTPILQSLLGSDR